MKASASVIIGELKDRGLKIESRSQLVDFINKREPKRHMTSLSKRWHFDGSCWRYLTSAGAIGPSGDVEFILDASFEDCLDVVGTADSWRETIGKHCVGNQLMTFAASIGFASVLLTPLKVQTSIGFCFFGKSRIGKSTSTDVGRSVTGTRFRTCSATQVGIEEIAHVSNGTLLTLDEIKQARPEVFAMNAYT